MRWLKRDPLNGIAIGMLLFLVLITWILIQVDRPQPGHATTGGTVQGTPTVNTTAVVQDQLKQQDEKLQRDNSFPWIILNAVGSSIGTILVAAAALIAAWLGWRQWLTNRKDEQKKREKEQEQRREDQLSEQEKRAEERFQKVVEGFGGDNEGAKVGAAILLRTFFRPGYEQFYTQTFDLAVANLRLPRTPHVSEDPDGVPYRPKDQESPLPLTTLSQALIVVFKEVFPLARNTIIGDREDALQFLDATNIQLDNAFLVKADLKQAWMPQTFLRKADLNEANLSGANLIRANLNGANLIRATLTSAYLNGATLTSAKLTYADLTQANLSLADLTQADLTQADLTQAKLLGTKLNGATLTSAYLNEADLMGAKLSGAVLLMANLSGAKLSGAKLSGANFVAANLSGAVLVRANLSGANLFADDLSGADLSGADLSDVEGLENVQSLKGTNLCKVKGLTDEQLAAYEAKGAIIKEGSVGDVSQPMASPSSLSPSNDAQAPLGS